MNSKTSKPLTFLKYFSLVAYITLSLILIMEACVNGESSANKSDSLGGFLANIFNNITGDQTKAILPTEVVIENDNDQYAVGDAFSLETLTLPENATYKSLNYYSSNPEVATISNSGYVSCLKEGSTTLTIENKDYPNIKDSLEINIYNVETSSIKTTINNALMDEDGIYTLFLNESYSITNTFLPENATNKKVTYDNSSTINISNDGVITTNKLTNFDTITINQGLISSTINYRIILKDSISLSHISHEPISIYISERFLINPTFYPSNTTFTEFDIVETSPSIEVIDSKFIVGLTEGATSIKITPKHNSHLSINVPVEIKKNPQVTSFKISKIPSLATNQEYKININSINPLNADIKDISYSSSDTNIAIINSDGIIKAINPGSCQIIASIGSYSTTSSLEVFSPLEQIDNFSVILNQNNFKINNTYSLSNLINVTSWNPTVPNSEDISIYLEDTSLGNLEDNILLLSKPGITNLIVMHNTSGTYQKVKIYSCPDFGLLDENEERIQTINNIVGKKYTVKFEGSIPQIKYIPTDYTDYHIINLNNDGFEIISPYEGEHTIKFNAYHNGILLCSEDIKINTSHIFISDFALELLDIKNNITSTINDSITIIRSTKHQILTSSNNEPTIQQYIFTSSNSAIATINSKGVITPKNAGKTSIKVTEKFTQKIKEFELEVINIISFLDNKFTLSGEKVSKIDDSSYSLTNGYSATLKLNFTTDSTFTTAKFTSSNTNVATISDNGIITPLKTGVTNISISINDGYLNDINFSFKLTIERQDYIKDLPAFYLKVRKALGHFGAFFVLGVFSSLTYYLFLNKNKRTLSIIINVSQGAALAGLTELIQLLTPGRTGTMIDVLIDFSGFIIAAIILTIIFIIKEKDPSKEESK